MASLQMKIKAERRIRELLDREGVPAPDRVEYGYGCIRLLWQEAKLCLVIDIDDYSEVEKELAERGVAPFDWGSEEGGHDPSDEEAAAASEHPTAPWEDPTEPPRPQSSN